MATNVRHDSALTRLNCSTGKTIRVMPIKVPTRLRQGFGAAGNVVHAYREVNREFAAASWPVPIPPSVFSGGLAVALAKAVDRHDESFSGRVVQAIERGVGANFEAELDANHGS